MTTLDRGAILLVLGLLAALLLVGCASQDLSQEEFTPLRLGDGNGWAFVNGPWQENSEGIIAPGEEPAEEHLAFYTAHTYADFEVEFDFRWDTFHSGSGFVFRARDALHYYLVHFPCTGQQYRAEHFWAAISKVDESGWVKVLKMEIVRGVPSEVGLWHHVRLQVQGDQFRLWVDRRVFPVVQDQTYSAAGYVGLQAFKGGGRGPRGSFRNLRIRGRRGSAKAWDDTIQTVRNYFIPSPETTYGNQQHPAGITQTPNGDLLMKLWITKKQYGREGVAVSVRSTDKGRSWLKQQRLPDRLSGGLLHTTRTGSLMMHILRDEPPFQLLRATSTDNGKTWSEPELTGEIIWPPEKPFVNVYVYGLLELQDGSLLMFMGPRTLQEVTIMEGRRYKVLPPPGFASYCLRSTDNGASWSDPINLDGPPYDDRSWMIVKDEFSEVSAAQTRQGRILALIRPYSSPWMWETWSEDGGISWAPAARGPFAMYASHQSMVATNSKVLLIGGRHPGLSLQASYDDGLTWKCTRIDTAIHANGAMLEVEPDVVLYIYMGSSSGLTNDGLVRAQLIHVTPEGLEPVRVLSSE
jgi:hypothetical protein